MNVAIHLCAVSSEFSKTTKWRQKNDKMNCHYRVKRVLLVCNSLYKNGWKAPSALLNLIGTQEIFSILLLCKTATSRNKRRQNKALKLFWFSLCRADDVVDECNQRLYSITSSKVYLPNWKSEKNYVRRFLNGRQLRVTTIEVFTLISNHYSLE